MSDSDIHLVVVLRTGDMGVAMVARSILEAARVDYTVRGEHLRNTFGWDVQGFLPNVVHGLVEFLVREDDASAARELLLDLEKAGDSTSNQNDA